MIVLFVHFIALIRPVLLRKLNRVVREQKRSVDAWPGEMPTKHHLGGPKEYR